MKGKSRFLRIVRVGRQARVVAGVLLRLEPIYGRQGATMGELELATQATFAVPLHLARLAVAHHAALRCASAAGPRGDRHAGHGVRMSRTGSVVCFAALAVVAS